MLYQQRTARIVGTSYVFTAGLGLGSASGGTTPGPTAKTRVTQTAVVRVTQTGVTRVTQ